MNTERERFQEILLEHADAPTYHGTIKGAQVLEGRERDSGDYVRLYLNHNTDTEGLIVQWEAEGSAVFRASCDLMCEAIEGLSATEAEARAATLITLLTHPSDTDDAAWQELGDAVALRGIQHLPARVRCAVLPWRTLQQGLSRHA